MLTGRSVGRCLISGQFFVSMASIAITYERHDDAMTLQELKYLVAVAREKHFGRAAEKCFVSQPSLSVAIKHLEEELGVALFERTKTDVVVTDIGQQIVTQAEKVLEESARIKQLATAGKDELQGALKLGVIHTVAPYLLPELVAALRERAPRMPLDIEENMTENLDHMLRSNVIDVAILALPFDAPGVVTTAVYAEAFEVLVPAKHPWSRRKQIAADALNDENLLLLSVGHCFRDHVLEACSRFRRPTDAGKQGNSLETLRSMVATGLGITVMPATATTARYRSPLIKHLPFSPPQPQRTIALATRHGFYRPRAVQLLTEVLRQLPLPITPI
jgi:LysR family transcriptional regulator, hydrogen peroxide-inducible genes activator